MQQIEEAETVLEKVRFISKQDYSFDIPEPSYKELSQPAVKPSQTRFSPEGESIGMKSKRTTSGPVRATESKRTAGPAIISRRPKKDEDEEEVGQRRKGPSFI
jgi:hypothetical protein